MNRVYFLFFLPMLFACASIRAQEGWVLKKEKDNIKVYGRSNSHSKFDELKVELILKSRLSDLAAIILDINNYFKWSYNTKLSYVLKKVSNDEMYFYTEVNSPWPASNRDLVVHLKIVQDPVSKIMTIRATGVPDFIPPKDNIVRVPFSKETWTVIPVDKTTIKIEYYLEIDPGEFAPAWLINLFAAKAPLESFKNLATQVQQPEYRQASIPFIKN